MKDNYSVFVSQRNTSSYIGTPVCEYSQKISSWILRVTGTTQLDPCSAQSRASLAAHTVKNLPAMLETWVQSLSWENLPEKGKATPSSILSWRIPWIIQSMGCKELDVTDWLSLSLSRNKCLESDGFMGEFYQIFRGELTTILWNRSQKIAEKGKLHLQENIGRILSDLNHSNIFSNPSPRILGKNKIK